MTCKVLRCVSIPHKYKRRYVAKHDLNVFTSLELGTIIKSYIKITKPFQIIKKILDRVYFLVNCCL